HGEVPPLPMEKRRFAAAMVLVTRQPATQPYLDQVADWGAIFAGELTSTNPEWTSFSTTTGGRASITYKVGTRRELGPGEVLDFSGPYYKMCDPTTQNCGAGLACYGAGDLYCAVPGSAERDAPCEDDSDCKAGLLCSYSITGEFLCAPYCDMDDPAAANACETLCPNGVSPILDPETLEEVAAFCFGGAGGVCDPLAQDCPEGQACGGLDVTACEPEGTTQAGAVCSNINGSCEAGATCVGIEGEADLYCQPYCDSAPDAPADIACTTLCPAGAWEFEGYSLCIPD
ncbi:MAG TPA: hypothetical protein VGK73_14060, partial [Polyangiaceae bacterium]